jgi:hypothetical protein
LVNTLNQSLCTASSNTGGNVNIRTGPGTTYTVSASLAYGLSVSVVGQSRNGWYQVAFNSQTGWVSGSVISLTGSCVQLPDVTPAEISVSQTNSFTNPLQLNLDRDGWGNVSDRLSYMETDPRDLILMTVTNLTTLSPDNYREFSLTLFCSGAGMDFVRWGAPEQPTLHCGNSVVLPATWTYAQQRIAVTLLDRSGLSDVNYMLYAEKRKA